MLSSVKLITRAFGRPSFLHHQLKCVPLRGFGDAHSSTVFVGLIPRDVTEEELKGYFPTCLSTRIITNKFDGSSKGYGFVDFATNEEATETTARSIEISGISLNIKMAENRLQKKMHKHNIGDDRLSSTLFVGHLPNDMEASELQSLFPGSIDARIMSDGLSGKSKGYGFVDFSTPEAAKENLTISGTEIRGRRLFVDFSAGRQQSHRKRNEPSSTLFVGNLSFDTTLNSLKEAFNGCTNARIMTFSDSGKSRGFGFVEYASVEEAKQLLDGSKNFNLDGRVLTINFAKSRVGEDVGGDMQQEPFEPKDDVDRDMSFDDRFTEK